MLSSLSLGLTREVPLTNRVNAEYKLGQKGRMLGGQKGHWRQPAQQPCPCPPHSPLNHAMAFVASLLHLELREDQSVQE